MPRPAADRSPPAVGPADAAAADTALTAGDAPPPAAAEIFGTALPQALRYARLLAGPAAERGLIGPEETGRIWTRHLLNCAAVAELVPHPAAVVDLGSGAGLPGIVLAMLLPDIEVTLLEPMARRVAFLTECVAELNLGNAVVRRGRAEDMAGRLAADVVVARAVAPLDRLAVLAAGLARPGGLVLAMKGAGAADEMTRAQSAFRRLGVRDIELVEAGSGKVEPAVTVVRFTTGPAAGRPGRPTPPGRHGRRAGLAAASSARPGSGAGARPSRMDRPGGRKGG
jgi:16S rRNA (guanine527-N7)-methyltransferase